MKWKSRPMYLIIMYSMASICFISALLIEYYYNYNKKTDNINLTTSILNFIGFVLVLIYQYNIKWIEGFSILLVITSISFIIMLHRLVNDKYSLSLFKDL